MNGRRGCEQQGGSGGKLSQQHGAPGIADKNYTV
jgi:hypothetical protein